MQDVLTATSQPLPETQGNLFFRNDTILGICEGLGEDFGFNPTWLRVALCAGLFFAPAAVIGGYLGIGLILAASRFLFPKPRADASAAPQLTADERVPAAIEEQQELPLAA